MYPIAANIHTGQLVHIVNILAFHLKNLLKTSSALTTERLQVCSVAKRMSELLSKFFK